MANDYKEYQFINHVRVNKIRVKCFRCGQKMTVRFDRESLMRGIEPPPKLCSSCKDVNPDGHLHGDLLYLERLGDVEAIIKRIREGIAVKTYRPGDPGFDEIAAQCTPPKLIKDHTRIPFLDWGKL